MLSDADYLYISNSLQELYSLSFSMRYVPLSDDIVSFDNYGELIQSFDEDQSFTVYGVLSLDESKQIELDRKDSHASNRVDGIIKLVVKQVIDAGKKIRTGDAIDVLDEYNNWIRYVITGIDRKVEFPNILTRLTVTQNSYLFTE